MSVTEFSADAWQASSPGLAKGLVSRSQKLTELAQGLEELAGSENISGEGADAMRAYIREVHLPIVKALSTALRTFQTAVGKYWSQYGQVDGSGDFWLVRDELSDHQTKLLQGVEQLNGFATQLRAITTGVPGFEAVGAVAAGKADGVVTEFDALHTIAKGQEDAWVAYEATEHGFTRVQEALAKLKSITKDVGNLAVGKGRKYVTGGFDASFEGLQDLLIPMDEYCRTNAEVAAASWEGMFAQYREDKAARKPWFDKRWDSVYGSSGQMFSILSAFALGVEDRSVAYDADSPFTQLIREFWSTNQYREKVRAALRDGMSLSDLESGGYRAGTPGLTNLHNWRDALTVAGQGGGPFNPFIPGDNRVLVTLGTYELTAETAIQTGPNSAVVRYTVFNDSTLGPMLRDGNDDHYKALNDWAGTSGPFSRYTETFTWEETVTW